jgi:hypothetical protein
LFGILCKNYPNKKRDIYKEDFMNPLNNLINLSLKVLVEKKDIKLNMRIKKLLNKSNCKYDFKRLVNKL